MLPYSSVLTVLTSAVRSPATTPRTGAPATPVAPAKALGYMPLVARAHYAHGLGAMLQAKQVDAMTSLDIATTTALETGDDATAVESFARLIYSISSSEPKDVPAGMQVFYAILDAPEKFIQDAANPHGGYALDPGIYRFDVSREFDPFAEQARRVAD